MLTDASFCKIGRDVMRFAMTCVSLQKALVTDERDAYRSYRHR